MQRGATLGLPRTRSCAASLGTGFAACVIVHRNLAPPPALALLEAEHTAGKVHALAGQPENLLAAYPRAEREPDDRAEERVLADSSILYLQQLALFAKALALGEKPE